MDGNPEQDITRFLSNDLLQQAIHEVSGITQGNREVFPPVIATQESLKFSQVTETLESVKKTNHGLSAPRIPQSLDPGALNFSSTTSGIGSSVILVPSVNPDGTYAFSLHPQSTAVKIHSPIKVSPSNVHRSVQMTDVKVNKISLAPKSRQPPIILPKCSPLSSVTGATVVGASFPHKQISIDSTSAAKSDHREKDSITSTKQQLVSITKGSTKKMKNSLAENGPGAQKSNPEYGITSSQAFSKSRSDTQCQQILTSHLKAENKMKESGETSLLDKKLSFTNLLNQSGNIQPQNILPNHTLLNQTSLSKNHISHHLPKEYLIKAENNFSVAAFVREMTARGRRKNKVKNRGRPRKGMPKRVNEKKIISDLKKELGLREERVKEFGFIEAETEEDVEGEEDAQGPESLNDRVSLGRTRSGRLSRPPKRILKDLKIKTETEEGLQKSEFKETATSGAVTNMNQIPPPVVESTISSSMGKRAFAPPARYICKVCGKLYLGDKKIARHLKHFPDHGFATPEPPSSPVVKKSFSAESWISEVEATPLLDLAGPKIFQSFSLWDLLVKKVSLKQLGTAEVLSSMFADIQALVMDLKNMVEQCLTSIRTNEDSFSVTLSPMISSILGQSQNGGVERFVLPYNQIPVHYHMLLGFPMGFKNTQTTDILSPDSTNSIFHPEEENSQMSLSSDINDRPLVDKVVLEANLGTRTDLDEETQDSSRMSKRARLDSESRSASSPPPQTPDFLNHEEESNLSASSNICSKELNIPETCNSIDDIPVKEFAESGIKLDVTDMNSIRKKLIDITTRAPSAVSLSGGRTIFTESTRTRLPSFSSIMCGSPKPSSSENDERANGNTPSDSNTSMEISPVTDNSSIVDGVRMKNLELTRNQVDVSSPNVGGSAPVSPGLDYVRSLSSIHSGNINFQRRSSVDQSLLHSSNKLLNDAHPEAVITQFSTEKTIDMVDSLADLQHSNINERLSPETSHTHEAISPSHAGGVQRNYSYSQENISQMIKAPVPSPVTSPFQSASDNAVFNVTAPSPFSTSCSSSVHTNFLVTSNKSQLVGISRKSYEITDNYLSQHLKENMNTLKENMGSKKEYPALDLMISKTNSEYFNCLSQANLISSKKTETLRQNDFECNTQVTFSELNHPIPSVSPIKDTLKEYEENKQSQPAPPISQSPNLFNDIESVLNDSEEFSFHSALSSNVENVPAKTPEKLLTSVPPSVIMNNKKTLIFESYEFVKPVSEENLEAKTAFET